MKHGGDLVRWHFSSSLHVKAVGWCHDYSDDLGGYSNTRRLSGPNPDNGEKLSSRFGFTYTPHFSLVLQYIK